MIEEPKNWMNQWPPAVLRREIKGDQTYALRFWGMALRLLWDVKGAMGANNLRQNWGTRIFEDGTVIRASSIYGQDTIEIDASRALVGLFGKCSITLINVPSVIQPGMHPSHIHIYGDDAEEGFGIGPSGRWGASEIEGVHYFKTYYRFENTCQSCDPLDWSAGDLGDFVFQVGNSVGPNPFIYSAPPEPYYGGLDYPPDLEAMGFKDIPPDPNNHCVWSFSGCNAEIIESGRDAGGDFIKWKAYTEWSSANLHSVTFSRTGLGYMKLKAFIKKPNGDELCSAEAIVKVDCCHKESSDRIVNLYWEFLSGWPWNCMNQPWFIYGTAQWCEVPEKMNFWYMARIATWYGFNITPLPELKGSCIPFEWTLQGPGIITPFSNGGNFNEWCNWALPKDFSYAHPKAEESCRDVVITGKDRCGNEKKITGSCCKYGGCSEINILYTSIWMDFNSTQFLTASCGCAPFTWTATNGSFVGATDGNTVTFKAPSSNVDCHHHPAVTVTDCCGITATLQMYASNYTYQGMAMQMSDAVDGGCLSRPYDYGTPCYWLCDWNGVPPYGPCHTVTYFTTKYWGCDGQVISVCQTAAPYIECNKGCGPGHDGGDCSTNECAGHSPSSTCGTLYDERTPAFFLAGCCPVNPITGLPMDPVAPV